MKHRTIRGKIRYAFESGEETGREWFTTTIHSDGGRTIRTLTEMDDRGVLRDATLTVDKDWYPLDCFARVVVHDCFVGTGWFRFTEKVAEGEIYLADGGRITQRWPLDKKVAIFGPHAVANDVWQIAQLDRSRPGVIQSAGPRLWTSPLPDGGDGPLIGYGFRGTRELGVVDLVYVGQEEITVPAGTFLCEHANVVRPGESEPIEFWATGENLTFVRLRFPHLGQLYELVEYEDSGSD